MDTKKIKKRLGVFLTGILCALLLVPALSFSAGEDAGEMKVHPQLSHEEEGSPAYESAEPEGIKIRPQESKGPLDEGAGYPAMDYEHQEIIPWDNPLTEEDAAEKAEPENLDPREGMKETPQEQREEDPTYPLKEY